MKWGAEMDDEVKCTLQDVSKSVLALVVDVEESQVLNQSSQFEQ